MVTVDGDCHVNKSDENKWLDWRGNWRKGRGGDGGYRRPAVELNWRKWTHMGTDSAEAGRKRIKVC